MPCCAAASHGRARHVDRLAGEPLPSAIEMRPLAGSHRLRVPDPKMLISCGGSPKCMVCKGKSENPIRMDDDYGYPYFRKPNGIMGKPMETNGNQWKSHGNHMETMGMMEVRVPRSEGLEDAEAILLKEPGHPKARYRHHS